MKLLTQIFHFVGKNFDLQHNTHRQQSYIFITSPCFHKPKVKSLDLCCFRQTVIFSYVSDCKWKWMWEIQWVYLNVILIDRMPHTLFRLSRLFFALLNIRTTSTMLQFVIKIQHLNWMEHVFICVHTFFGIQIR